jgi:hypothetical protein
MQQSNLVRARRRQAALSRRPGRAIAQLAGLIAAVTRAVALEFSG